MKFKLKTVIFHLLLLFYAIPMFTYLLVNEFHWILAIISPLIQVVLLSMVYNVLDGELD